MKIVALLAVRNEELMLAHCLEHLYQQGIETYLIDYHSSDRTLEIAKTFQNRGLLQIESQPFSGKFDLETMLQRKEQLAKKINADWFLNVDADQIRKAPAPYLTLKEAFQAVTQQGYNAIAFDEWVYIPRNDTESFETTDYVETMQYGYRYQPRENHRIDAWAATKKINLQKDWGYRVRFKNQKIFPTPFQLHHYMALSRTHALAKYGSRIFTKNIIINSKWHRSRVTVNPKTLNFTKVNCISLKDIPNSTPLTKHLWFGAPSKALNPLGAGRIYRHLKKKPTRQPAFSILRTLFSTPIPFVVGAPRSGTTLLRLMMDAHPDLAIPPETQFIHNLPLEGENHFNSKDFFLKTILQGERWPHFQIDAELFQKEILSIKNFTFSEGLRRFYQLYADKFNKKRWGDKNPSYLLEMIRIQQLIPEAHFIHIIRDGRDVALSLRDLWWGPGNNLEAQAAFWQNRIRDGQQQAQFCRNYLEIRYENLLLNTHQELQKICSFLHLPYDSQMERYYERAPERLQELVEHTDEKGQKRTAYQSIHRLTQKPPDPSRIGHWKKVMTPEEQARYEKVAGNFLKNLGYY